MGKGAWEIIIPGDQKQGDGAMSNAMKKKPLLQALFDTLEKAGEPRYNPSGYHNAAMYAEDATRKQKVITLLELLGSSAIPERQRKTVIKRLRELMARCAFPGVYHGLIDSLEAEEGSDK